ncbi:MAG TPA: ABC transporter permease, partial [Vicinamibacteria bacterium]
MDDLKQDLRFALRTLARNPGFTLVVVLTLALGIGANTAIFTLMDQVLLRVLPVREPERLVVLDAPGPNQGSRHSQSASLSGMSYPMYTDFRDKAEVFDGVVAHWQDTVHLGVKGATERADADLVSGNFFQVLGVRAALGRVFSAEDDQTPGAHPLVVLSHGFWQRRFGKDPSVVGLTVSVNSRPMTVIGVSAAGFHGVEVGRSIDLFLPVAMQETMLPNWGGEVLSKRRVVWLTPLARLKPGLDLAQAKAGANVLYKQILQEELAQISTRSERFKKEFPQKTLELLPGNRGTSELRGQSQTTLLVLMGMVGLVLLIACANVANLLLARASARQREVAVRLALGASRPRLVRQFLAESVLLSLIGGTLGLFVSSWTANVLLAAEPGGGAARVFTADPDPRVAGFAVALSLLTGIVFGLVPALQSTRPDVFPTLKTESGGVISGTRAFRFRKGLVVAQVALSLLLLVGAGLFTRSLMNLRHLDPGFQADNILTFAIDPSRSGYDDARKNALFEQLQDELLSEPGVEAASMAELGLLAGNDSSSTVRVEGYESKEGENMNPNFNGVGPGFFRALAIPLVRGREFERKDAAGAPRVAIVNEVFAKYFFGEQDAVGRHFYLGRRGGKDDDYEIVGLVRDGKASQLRETPRRMVYLPYAQETDVGSMTFYVRTRAEPAALGPRLRKMVASVDSNLPVTDMKTLHVQIAESLFVERLVAGLSAAFGFLATLLAALGLYGVMSYTVSQRTREIGIRMALGAERRAVLGLVLHEVALLAGLGILLGLPSGYALGRLILSQLFGLSAADPLTFAVATAALVAAALLAGYLPAARAARVDP